MNQRELDEIAERAKFGRSMPDDVPKLLAALKEARDFVLCTEPFLAGTHAKLAKVYVDRWLSQ